MNWKVVFVALVVLMAVACSKSDLDRETAQKLVEKSEQVQRLSLVVSTGSGFYDEGVAQGLWTKVSNSETRLSDRAAKEISAIGNDHLSPVVPAKVMVTVTGVKESVEGSKIRMVEFTWGYDGLAPLVKRFALSGGSGSAVIELYDDGWRVSSVNISTQKDRVVLSEGEVQAISADTVAEASRKENERTQVLQSIIPQKIVKEFNGVYYNAPKKIAIADTGVIFYTEDVDAKSGWGTGVMRPSGFRWFGTMANPRLGQWGIEYDFPSVGAPSINPERIGLSMTAIDYNAFLAALKPALAAWQARYQAIPREARMKHVYEVDKVWRESKIWEN